MPTPVDPEAPYTLQGSRIAAARESKKWSQTDLADAVRQWLRSNTVDVQDPEIAQSTVSRWEKGLRLPKGQTLAALEAILGLEMRYILGVPESGQKGRTHPETVEADEAMRLIDDLTPERRRAAIAILKVLSSLK